jgi:hypothetical protein
MMVMAMQVKIWAIPGGYIYGQQLLNCIISPNYIIITHYIEADQKRMGHPNMTKI